MTDKVQTQAPMRYKGKPRDLKWGKYDYPVTPSQKKTLEALWYMMSGLPRSPENGFTPVGYFCSQRVDTGTVIIGLNHESINVHRSGHITSNEGK